MCYLRMLLLNRLTMRYRYSELFLPFQWLIDVALLNLAFWGASYLWLDMPRPWEQPHYVLLGLAVNLIWVLLVLMMRPYAYTRVSFTLNNLLMGYARIVAMHLLLVGVFWMGIQGYYYSRGQLLLMYLFFVGGGLLWRLVGLFAIKYYRAQGYNRRNFVVIGTGPLTKVITQYYATQPDLGYTFQGYFGTKAQPRERGTLNELELFLQENEIHYIYCAQPDLSGDEIKYIVALAERYHLHVHLVLDSSGFVTHKAEIEYHDYLPVIKLATQPFSNVREEVAKRLFDIVFASAVLLLGSPIFAGVALAVKLTSSGPVFFTQKRAGRWGKPFMIVKFRSMYVAGEAEKNYHSQGKGDPRITPIGHFLRQSRLDELPQFFNVLRGDMSVVGPRPLAYYDVDMLLAEAPREFRRVLTIRPGITSIGQLKVGYTDTAESSVHRLYYDLTYLEKSSFRYDMLLIAKTVLIMMQGRGK